MCCRLLFRNNGAVVVLDDVLHVGNNVGETKASAPLFFSENKNSEAMTNKLLWNISLVVDGGRLLPHRRRRCSCCFRADDDDDDSFIIC